MTFTDYMRNLPWVTRCALNDGLITVDQLRERFGRALPPLPDLPREHADDLQGDYDPVGTRIAYEWGE